MSSCFIFSTCSGDNVCDLSGLSSALKNSNSTSQHLQNNCNELGLTFSGHTELDGNCFFNAISDQLYRLCLDTVSPYQL